MKLEVTAQSKSLEELIKAKDPELLNKLETARIKGSSSAGGAIGIEILYIDAPVYVDTIGGPAVVGESRPMSEENPVFAANVKGLEYVHLISQGTAHVYLTTV